MTLKNYAIYLKGHDVAETWLPTLLESARKHGWDVEPFEGINGLHTKLEDQKIKIDNRYEKSRKQMSKPGVQGCFLSHYNLWLRCLESNETIGIFEYDVLFEKSPPSIVPFDILKLAGFRPSKPASTGNWWGGAYAYIITPAGAEKLVAWVDRYGASPADFMLGDKVANIGFDLDNRIKFIDFKVSLTENIEQI